MFTPSVVNVGSITLLFDICKIIYLFLLIINDNLFYCGHSVILYSSLFIKYSVSALFVSFVKVPNVLTRKILTAYVMSLKTILAFEKSL